MARKAVARRGRPPADTAEIRARLIEAASRIFNVNGYFGTDSNKIAREAGVAPATFYRHFDDKLDVFLKTYAYWVEREWQVIERAGRALGSEVEIVDAIVAAMLEHHRAWRGVRASMHALIVTEKAARRFGDTTRKRQIERMIGNIDPKVRLRHSDADLAFSFLSIERANNAVTDGDLAALGIDEQTFVERLKEEVRYLRSGIRTGTRGSR